MRRALLSIASLGLLLTSPGPVLAAGMPNVLIIMTDDQGHGDLGVHGNPVIKTPNLDRLASESVRLTRFHVSPVCSPTRSSLMTGRYNYRTRVVDTYIGRSMMDPDEVTLAERLAAAGYRTGIFGKWHLGDNYPLRPIDQGFQEALVLKGGGIGQPSDPPDGSSYFDPVLQHNGNAERRQGYCSDVLTDAAMRFIAESKKTGKPFFTYLAFNCPHDPLQLPDSYLKPYAEADLSNARFPSAGYPLPGPISKDTTARVYGMVTNIDDNLGRLFKHLQEMGIERETLVIFLTDNGPAHIRYVSGMRGRKGSVYDGGVRVPCFVRLPGVLPAGEEIETIAAHIDLAPTVLEACGVPVEGPNRLDGKSLWPLLTGKQSADAWPSRTLFFQWHRGDAPERFRAFAAREPRYKLVRAEGPRSTFELFDMKNDPSEIRDVSAEHPEVVERMKKSYSDWYDDVSRTRGYDPPRIRLGSTQENPSTLTRQDWRGPRAGWGPGFLGYWEVEVDRPGTYRVTAAVRPPASKAVAHLRFGSLTREVPFEEGATTVRFDGLTFPAGPGRLEAWLDRDGKTTGVWSLDVERLGE